MSVAKAVRALQSYPDSTSREFREQLEIINKIQAQQNQDKAEAYRAPDMNQGIDRAQSLRPIARPSLLRAFSRTH
ncbi:hypothetical protein [Rhizobium leguminosarum]|uniref:hypothetical protein n=1 Tax=Rhizobium leguminosarum TaxID=384 RepID=UPI0013BD9259|nr:hypothetical protein [Rhizobium leguminosarum]NEI63947.1 hypothetical protein [Rhizobium leguminosarum]